MGAQVVVLGLDPALSGDKTADEVGIAKGALIKDHVYLTDLSDKLTPEDYARIIVRECQRDASGVVVERNHVGQHARDLIRVHARLAGMQVELLPDAARVFPPRRQGVIFVREITTHTSVDVAPPTLSAPPLAANHIAAGASATTTSATCNYKKINSYRTRIILGSSDS